MAERRERVAKWQAERRDNQPDGAADGDGDAAGAGAGAAVDGAKEVADSTDADDADDEAGPGEAQDLGDSELTLADEDGLMAQEGTP
jgi:hypothetical protein